MSSHFAGRQFLLRAHPEREASYWSGLGAPGNTPALIVDRLNPEVNAALADPGAT
jgi:hypothetical protein